MFTGIVETAVPVRRFEPQGEGARLILPSPGPDWELTLGQSISVCGACLTVAAIEGAGDGAELAFTQVLIPNQIFA